MKKAFVKKIYDFLKDDSDFLNTYEEALRKQINESKSLLCDLVFEAYKINDSKEIKRLYKKQLKNMLDSLHYEIDETNEKSLLENYVIPGANLGISWIRIDDVYLDGDMLYLDFKAHCNG